MSQDVLYIIGSIPAFQILILILLRLGFEFWDICLLMAFVTYIFLVATFLSLPRMLPASSAAPPACLDGFTVETNGGTGGAYTCTPLPR